MDNKGIISSETMIVLILIILILGIMITYTEKTNDKLTETISSENIEKQTINFCDNIINNPGTPKDWNSLKNKNNVIAGLGIVDENNHTIPNSVSYEKFMALNEDYDKIIGEKIFDNQLKSSMTLTPLTGSIDKITIGQTIDNNPTTVNRLVICDFFKKYTINDFEKDGKCNHYHLTTHSCNHLKIYKSWLKKTDYYLLFEKNSYKNTYWTIDSTKIPNLVPKLVNSEKIYLNPKIEQNLLFDSDGIIFFHIDKENPKVVLVGVPKDFDKSKLSYDYFVRTNCNLMVQTSN